jgi:long-chain acyl-CoA synthetase
MSITHVFDILELYQTPEWNTKIALAIKRDENWVEFTGAQYIENVRKLSLGLLELGIKKGDRVATVLKNCPEWNFIDMALLRIGAVQVPIYSTISESNYSFIFKDAEVKLVFVSDKETLDRLGDAVDDVPAVDGIYSVLPVEGLPKLDDIIEKGAASNRAAELDQIKAAIDPGEMATLIYTSGTTGEPKGVMLSHTNLVSNSEECAKILTYNPVSKALSFLPLCHVLERIVNYIYQREGVSIYYCDNLEKLGDFIRETKPEIFSAVPRVLEKTYEKIIAKGRDLKGIKKILFFWAVNLGERYDPTHNMGAWYNWQLSLARKLIFSKWNAALGGKLKTIVCGGASLQERLARVFMAAGYFVIEGYGLTETSPVIAVSRFTPGDLKIGTVGPVIPGVEVKIAEDGEILTKGPNLMLGYYKRPDFTAEVIDQDGWFHTGDIGVMEGKFLRITDRKKEMFKTSGGKYIAPQPLENKLKESSFIENALVVGENKNFAAAIIVPSFTHLESWCRVKGRKYPGPKEAIKDEVIVSRIEREVNELNEGLDKHEQIKKIVLVADTWSPDGGELSPTMKLKRKFLTRKYSHLIEGIYLQK